MADVRWIGGAAAVAQVDDFTPSDPAESDTITLTVTGENGDTVALVYTATATHTVAASVAGMVALWNASTHYLCTPITASDNASTTIKLTADTAGVPFYVTPSCSAGTFTRAATTANSGPYDYNTVQNWDLGAVPGYAGDQVIYIEGATILYGLNQTAGTTGADAVYINDSQVSSNPSTGRDAAYLTYDVGTVFRINQYSGPGSPTYAAPIYLKVTTAAATVTVYNTGTNSDTTIPACNLVLTDSNSKLIIWGGTVGLSYFPGDSASVVSICYMYGSGSLYCNVTNTAISTLYMNSSGTVGGDARIGATALYINSGTFNVLQQGGVGTAICNGGTCTINNTIDNLIINGGVVYQYDQLSAVGKTITAMTMTGGTFYSRATGTVTLANILGGTCDASAEIPRTWTTVKIDPPGSFKCNTATQTLTNKIQPNTATKIITYSAS
jgi:hypothetical protein